MRLHEYTNTQISAIKNVLFGAAFGTLWIDVELYKWGKDLIANEKYVADLCDAANVAFGNSSVGV
jgi:hypothetical protein